MNFALYVALRPFVPCMSKLNESNSPIPTIVIYVLHTNKQQGICSPSTGQCTCFQGWWVSINWVKLITIMHLRRMTSHSIRIIRRHGMVCSVKRCPVGPAWVDEALSESEAHQPAECSGMGICDARTGKCTCRTGFIGLACEVACVHDWRLATISLYLILFTYYLQWYTFNYQIFDCPRDSGQFNFSQCNEGTI